MACISVAKSEVWGAAAPAAERGALSRRAVIFPSASCEWAPHRSAVALKEVGMADLYAEIEPHAQGLLEVAGGDLVYWEVCGNPNGKPALVLHGGPGSGCTPWFTESGTLPCTASPYLINAVVGGADLTRVPLRRFVDKHHRPADL